MAHESLIVLYNIIIFILNSRTGDGKSDSSETGPEIIIISTVVAVVVLVVIVLVLIQRRKRRRESKSRGNHLFL